MSLVDLPGVIRDLMSSDASMLLAPEALPGGGFPLLAAGGEAGPCDVFFAVDDVLLDLLPDLSLAAEDKVLESDLDSDLESCLVPFLDES